MGTKTSSNVSGAVLELRMPCLSSGLPGVKPGHALLDDEERGPFGRLGEDGQEVGVAAVGDELLVAGDPVAGDGAVFVQ